MPSNARLAFEQNLEDINNLLRYYEMVGTMFREQEVETPSGADVVLRSAIVMLVTYWEAYVEDIVSEGVAHVVKHASDPNKLPKDLRKVITTELKADKDELAVWQLAGDGWRGLATKRLAGLCETRNRSFNSPKGNQTKKFFCESLGIPDITKAWQMGIYNSEKFCATLEDFVELRGEIAHRGKIKNKVTVEYVKLMIEFIQILVGKTGELVNIEIQKSCGTPLWE